MCSCFFYEIKIKPLFVESWDNPSAFPSLHYNLILLICLVASSETYWTLRRSLKELCFSGGMQDWNYLNTNCFEVTIELGCVKYPLAKDLPKYWEQNRRALLQFIHQVIIHTNLNITLSSLLSCSCVRGNVSSGPHWNQGHRLWHQWWYRNP